MVIKLPVVTILVFSLAVFCIAGVLTPTAAEGKCVPNRSPYSSLYIDGAYSYGGAPTGIQSFMFNYSPYVYSGYTSSAVVSLQYGLSRQFVAMLGWVEYSNGTRYTMAQYTVPGGGLATMTAPPQPVGTFTTYEIQYVAAPYRFLFTVNGSNPFGPVSSVNWYPNGAQTIGQINNFASQMPGGNNYPPNETFLYNDIEYGTTWQPFYGTAINSNSSYFGNGVNNSTFWIWDLSC